MVAPAPHTLAGAAPLLTMTGRVSNEGSRNFTITRAFSWMKAPTGAFTFKTLLRHYAEQALT